jgi:hypothetical protein
VSLVVNTRPTPNILIVAVTLGVLQNTGSQGPHDGAEDEKCNGEERVIDSDLLCSSVASSPVVPEDDQAQS